MKNLHISLNSRNSLKPLVLFFCFTVMVIGTKAQSYTLTISKSGTGGGTVTSDVGGINCGSTCSFVYASGTTVVITETPDATSSFSGWTGAASGTSSTQSITMSSNKSVNATFTRNNYALNVVTDGTGSGNVSSVPAGITCPGDCAENFSAGSSVNLTATPNAGSVFTGWSGGGCSGTGTCTISIASVNNVTATFTYVSNNYYPDNDGDGYGAGTVIIAAIQPPNTSINNTDCDDTNPSVHPGAAEICGNTTDDDCNSLVDDCFMFTLTISKSGSGGGTVTSNVGGINCGATCMYSYPPGTVVIITETPDATSSFSGWTGAASGTGSTQSITMDNNKSVNATFTRNNYALNVVTDGTGSGNVSSAPAGITCPGDCAENFSAGSSVNLTATPNAGSVFTGWSGGGCSGTGTCTISIASVNNVTATFTYVSNNYYPDNDGDGYGAGTVIIAAIQPPNTSINNTDCDDTNPSVHPGAAEICGNTTDDDCNSLVDDCFMFTLTISKSGSGGGTVTSNVGGINCGATCTYSYPPGTVVIITETPDATSSFSGWTGAASGTGSTQSITMNSNKIVSATFTKNNYSLNVAIDGTGSGNVSSAPAGISCPGNCAANYSALTSVNLTATSNAGSVFTGWSGGCSGTGTCSFTMMSNTSVSASFCLLPGNTGLISGNNLVCSGTTQTYNIAPVSNATSYTWTLPSGWTGSSTANTITVLAGNSGTISVVAVNSCGSGTGQLLNVTVDPIPQELEVKNGLVAFYPFNDNANDESVNSNNGTLYGPVPVNDRNSKPNSAYNFDGLDDYIMVNDPVPASLQIQNEISLSAWIYANQYPGTSNLGLIVGSQCDAGAKGASIFLDGRINSDGQPSPTGHIHFQIGNGSWHQANSNSQVPLNQWVLITATRKANENAKIYYNGVLQPSTSLPWNGSVSYTGAYFAMGRQRDYGNRFFKGSMDEVRVYNRALSEQEIKTLYQDKDIYVTRDSLCQNESTAIHLMRSENDISYQLLKNGNDAGNAQTGNGSELIFNTGSLASSSQFTLKATNSTTNCSIILDTILAIAVNPVYDFTEDYSICEGEIYTWHGTDYSEAGTYEAVYTTINGCDSIYTLNLTVNPVFAFTEDHSICEGQSYTWHGTDYTESGTYESVYTTINGCDSIYTLNLTVNPVYAFTENHSICEGESFTWHGTDYTESGTYESVYTTINGCDSIYTLNLTVNPVYAFTENHSICEGESFTWHGTDYTESGTYESVYITINGCDSIYSLNLEVKNVDVSVTRDGSVITANAIGAAYQWLDCSNNFLPVAGETSRSFISITGGRYAVEVSQNECSDTSESVEIVPTLIVALQTEGIFIYPNPVISELVIEKKGSIEKMAFEILNSSGQIVFTGNLFGKAIVNTSDFLPGVYMIKLKNGISFEIKKIIKE